MTNIDIFLYELIKHHVCGVHKLLALKEKALGLSLYNRAK